MPRLSDPRSLRAALPAQFATLAKHAVVGLAVSGGADSLALMLLAAEWAAAQAHPARLIVYTVDHALRPEAADEVRFVQREAVRLGLAARALRWEAKKPAAGLQAAARQARYRLISAAMRADSATLLLTAHHLDDQAETVLMRLVHGSGLAGLRGMDAAAEVEGVPVCRPLLTVPRAVLRQVVADAGLTPVADPSNGDSHYERVRWRQALPRLAGLGLDAEAVARFAERAGDAAAAIAAAADTAFAEHVTVDALGAARLQRAALLALPRAVGIQLLARLLALTGGGQHPAALGRIERLHERLTAAAPFPASTVLGARIGARGPDVWFMREPGRRPPAPMELAPAATIVWDRRFQFANRSSAPMTVGMAASISLGLAESLVGRPLRVPAAAVRGAPLVRQGAEGTPVALGTYRLGAGVEVELLAPMMTHAMAPIQSPRRGG